VLKKSGTKFPRVELEEIGPSMDWIVGRTKTSEELKKQSLRIPKIVKQKGHVLAKNIEVGTTGDKLGRLHLEKQEFNKMALKKMKGLKKRKRDKVVDSVSQEEGQSKNQKVE